MTDAIILKARELFLKAKLRGVVLEEAAKRGEYDRGTYIKDFIPQAETELLKEREEANDE